MTISKKRIVALSAAFLLISGTALSAAAQAQRARRDTRENITTLMLLRMTQALDLTEEQTARIYPEITRIEKEKLNVNRRLVKKMSDLRFLLRGEERKTAELQEAMDEIRALRIQVKNLEAELETFIMNNLDIEQQARFLLFFQDFYRQMRNKLNELRRRQQDRRAPAQRRLPLRPPAPPA